MGLRVRGMVQRWPSGQYQRLEKGGEKTGRLRWLRRVRSKLVIFRLTSSKRLKWMRSIVIPRRVIQLYEEIMRAMLVDAGYPSIIFSSQWGLPVLSHNSIGYRKRTVSLQRYLSSSSSATTFVNS